MVIVFLCFVDRSS